MNMDRMFMEALARRDSLITELAEWRAKAEVAELAERRAKEEVAELAEWRAKEIVAAEMAKRRADLSGRARSFAQGSLLLTLLFRRFLRGKPNAEELAGRVLQGKSRWSLPLSKATPGLGENAIGRSPAGPDIVRHDESRRSRTQINALKPFQ